MPKFVITLTTCDNNQQTKSSFHCQKRHRIVQSSEFTMGKQFMFVDTNNVDPKTRRKMRRHVMAGKNAGRTVHRPSKLALSSSKTRQLAAPLKDPSKSGPNLSIHQSSSPTSISGPLRSGLAGVKFAIEMGPYEHGIISTCMARFVRFFSDDRTLTIAPPMKS